MEPDILRLSERIDLAREVGESHFREFKSAVDGPPDNKEPRSWRSIAADIANTLVGFANADGGELIVGLEDNGFVSGIPHSQGDIEKLLASPSTKIHRDTPLPMHRVTTIKYEGKTLLYFVVQKGSDFVHLTSDGKCLQRKDLETVPVASEHIKFSRSERVSREYDRQFVDGASISDLDIELVSAVAEQVSKGMSVEKCLQHFDLAEFDGAQLQLRRAALLLFAKKPNRWHPRMQVRVLKIQGTELLSGEKFNVLSDEEVTRNILELVEESWELLRPHLTETKFSKDAVFRAQIIYPELACREALINAIAHRDYSLEGRGTEVKVYSDRLEVANPGGLLSSIRIEDIKQLKGVHQSRNSLVARVLREVGYMRELGEGVRRIHDLMNQNDLEPPEFRTDSMSFSISLHHKYVYSKEVKLWVDSFKTYELTRDEKTVVRLGYAGHEISPSEIWEAVGIVDTDYYRQLLESLVNKGILYRSTNRNKAYSIAKGERISKKNVAQFSIRSPIEGIRKEETKESLDESAYAKVYVGNVSYEATESNLIDAFSSYGEIDNVQIPVDSWTGKGRGFAFVEFQNLQAAKRVLESKQHPVLHGRQLYVQEYQGRRRPIVKP